ncbi:Tetratricopeptide-like helical domain [Trinorchestia longiramus]|nr:Tetratricopeptide-like helical domain [Trinorchestia longiramus]
MDTEDPKLLSGHIAMFLSDFTLAQDLYLSSGSPVCALEMRRDLLQWEPALQLARKLAPQQIPYIAREYAAQLEFTGDYPGALTHYERGIINSPEADDHNTACKAGIARTALRCGDIRRGVNIATELSSKTLKRECADILEGKKQYVEAATLYEAAGQYEKAAGLYIKLKNWTRVGTLLPNITAPKIHLQYAKAKEAEGSYREAVVAYEAAREPDSMVRILLHNLNSPEDAVAVVRSSKSVEGAKMVAKFFQRLDDYESAIQFLVLSKCADEAFQLARAHGKMELYAEILGDDASIADYNSLALHFDNEKNHLLAGKFYYKAGQYSKSLKQLERAATSSGVEDSEAMQLAIQVVTDADDDALTRQHIDFLMGEVDGIPKEAKYLFRLYMARKKYREAARTAVIIAREEQNAGNYQHAHDLLLGMCRELIHQQLEVPTEMASALLLLHSYTLARLWVKRGRHDLAARLLLRVANNISKFPAHSVPILTSTVIECHRAGLKSSSFNTAAMLMRPEMRDQIDEKYKKKIEAIVRKPQKGRDEEEEAKSPCPYCGEKNLAESALECHKCHRQLPYCIITVLASFLTSSRLPFVRTLLRETETS